MPVQLHDDDAPTVCKVLPRRARENQDMTQTFMGAQHWRLNTNNPSAAPYIHPLNSMRHATKPRLYREDRPHERKRDIAHHERPTKKILLAQNRTTD